MVGEHRVRHKVWRKQLADKTRQLLLGADRARERTELEILDGTELYSVVEEAAVGSVVRGPSPEAGSEPATGGEEWEEEEWEEEEWEDGNGGNWVAGTGANLEEAAAGGVAGAEPEAEPATKES